ncbi:unnamed protein product [Symbiodinium natans]|uniref:Mannose-P-dolichol utilization defect 1 protein homolog n=1 Tax=Symbiodinium natans TaxID=878477 RepID=A0A812KV21_9DINO|nr:unnamed protein product [Symbiodinium natans]
MVDMLDTAELKKLVITGLNWAMLAGSCLMKLPQINNILKAGSVVGLSETFVINDCIAGLLFVYYNVLSGHPFMSWGENVIVGVQNTIIIFLYWHYSPQLSKAPRFLGAVAFVVASVAVLLLGLPEAGVSALGTAPIILGNGSKVPQIWKNMAQKHTGTMAAVPALLGLAGCSVRVLTYALQTKDVVAILNPLAAAALWFILLLQFVLYWKTTKEVQKQAEAKRKEAGQKKAA